MEIKGRAKVIGAVQNISSTFRKRELVLLTDEQYPQNILIEFQNDKVGLLDNLQQGQMIEVSINLRGREWVNPQNEMVHFNTIVGWRISTVMDMQQGPQGQQQATGYYGGGSAVDNYHNQRK